MIPPVHLRAHHPHSRRASVHARAFPLNVELDGPAPHKDLAAVINFLQVETSARYAPEPSATYCNIYAYDVAYLLGVYLPRVWWTDTALEEIQAGRVPGAEYGKTVREMSANSLYRWLVGPGQGFGWTRHRTPGEAQDAANRGRLAVICAERAQGSGHISIVVPEGLPPFDLRAVRAQGGVVVPVQSQAGRRNYAASLEPGSWWERNHRAFGFWSAPVVEIQS